MKRGIVRGNYFLEKVKAKVRTRTRERKGISKGHPLAKDVRGQSQLENRREARGAHFLERVEVRNG